MKRNKNRQEICVQTVIKLNAVEHSRKLVDGDEKHLEKFGDLISEYDW